MTITRKMHEPPSSGNKKLVDVSTHKFLLLKSPEKEFLREKETIARVCLAFTRDLRRVKWPKKFRLDGAPLYDGRKDPREFLRMYNTVVEIAGGDDKAKAN